ncbi:MAG: hypothetical protein V4577_11005 [Bacteroidota bacterium]
MKEPKTYQFEKRNMLFDELLTVFLIGVLVYAFISVFPHVLIFLLILSMVGIFPYFQLYVLRINWQFNKYDAGKNIVINADRTSLTVTRGDEITIIGKDDVDRVEIYEQKNLGKFGKYEYIVIYAGQNQVLITDLTIPRLIYDRLLESFLSKKPRTYFKKRFNFIDESKFNYR